MITMYEVCDTTMSYKCWDCGSEFDEPEECDYDWYQEPEYLCPYCHSYEYSNMVDYLIEYEELENEQN